MMRKHRVADPVMKAKYAAIKNLFTSLRRGYRSGGGRWRGDWGGAAAPPYQDGEMRAARTGGQAGSLFHFVAGGCGGGGGGGGGGFGGAFGVAVFGGRRWGNARSGDRAYRGNARSGDRAYRGSAG